MKPGDWDAWCKKDGWSIADAAALLVGVKPTGVWPYTNLNDSQQAMFDDFIAAATSALGKPPLKSWRQRKYAVLPVRRESPDSMLIPPGDLVDFGTDHGFKWPGGVARNLGALKRTQTMTADEKRRLQFTALLGEIEARGVDRHIAIKIASNYQFSQNDLADLLHRSHPDFPRSGSTLKNYIRRAGIQLRRGRPSKGAENPLPTLFPELYPSTAKRSGTVKGTGR